MKVNNQPFITKLRNNKFLILVHRGSHGGNIIENTSNAVEVSSLQHADMAEVDISQSTDGDFFIFHDGGEQRLLNDSRNITTLSTAEIESKSYYNALSEKIDQKVETFDYLYRHVDHQTFLNVDRSWNYWKTFLPFLDTYQDMHEYLILKSPLKREFVQILNDHPIKYLYFPIVDDLSQLDLLDEFTDLNVIGLELIEATSNWKLLNSERLAKYRNGNYMLLANSIKLNDSLKLFAGLDDNAALLDGPNKSWDEILKLGINAIQTDWPDILNEYRQKL